MEFKILLCLVYIASFLMQNHAAKILVISAVTSKSMKMFMQSIAESLAETGHQVNVLILNNFVLS